MKKTFLRNIIVVNNKESIRKIKKAVLVANTGFSLYHFRQELMKQLLSQGWMVVAVANDEADYARKLKKEGIQFINIDIDHKGRNPFYDLLLIWRMNTIYRNEKPNIVHHFTIKPVIYGSIAGKLAGVSTIVNSITGLGYVFKKGGILKKLVIGLYKIALTGNTQNIFQNRDNYEYFIQKKIVKKRKASIILGSGVNTSVIKPPKKKIKNKCCKFLMVSRMLWSKGVSEFVSAAEKIKKRFPQSSFFMAGGVSGGGAIGNPEAVSEDWLNVVNQKGSVKWVGCISFKDVMQLLDDSDVFVLPSYYPEGVPRSLIEAAAKEKAIITTDTPGCREVVVDGKNGFLIPPKDITSLEKAMIKLIRNPRLIKKMGKNSRYRAVELFDEKKIIEQTVSVYKAVSAL
jgi:glycosyltransferase involved in cell wall biosynthesis